MAFAGVQAGGDQPSWLFRNNRAVFSLLVRAQCLSFILPAHPVHAVLVQDVLHSDTLSKLEVIKKKERGKKNFTRATTLNLINYRL